MGKELDLLPPDVKGLVQREKLRVSCPEDARDRLDVRLATAFPSAGPTTGPVAHGNGVGTAAAGVATSVGMKVALLLIAGGVLRPRGSTEVTADRSSPTSRLRRRRWLSSRRARLPRSCRHLPRRYPRPLWSFFLRHPRRWLLRVARDRSRRRP